MNDYSQLVKAAADDLLGGQVARTITADRVEHAMSQLAQRVAQQANDGVLLSLLTTEDVAEKFEITPRRVRAIVKRLNERGQRVGWLVPGTRQWLFKPEELSLLEPGKPGRPRKD